MSRYDKEWFIHPADSSDIKPNKCYVNATHVYPIADNLEHQLTGKCKCNPVFDEDNNLYTHNSFDGREAYTDYGRKEH